MKWVKRFPKKEGVYWYKYKYNDPIVIDVQRHIGKLYVAYGGFFAPLKIFVDSGEDAYWSDVPIQYPEEMKNEMDN